MGKKADKLRALVVERLRSRASINRELADAAVEQDDRLTHLHVAAMFEAEAQWVEQVEVRP